VTSDLSPLVPLHFLFRNPSQHFITKRTVHRLPPTPAVKIYSALLGTPASDWLARSPGSLPPFLYIHHVLWKRESGIHNLLHKAATGRGLAYTIYMYILLRYLWICINSLSKYIQRELLKQRLVKDDPFSCHRGRFAPTNTGSVQTS
jgi:hypothetical protein